jgi:putative transposase
MSFLSKNLYNQALFEVKAHYSKTGKTLSYPELDKIMKTKANLEGSINYRLLPAKVAQQTLMLVSQNIGAFFAALSDYKENPSKYASRPKFPHFLPKEGYFVCVFTNQQAKILKEGKIQLTKDITVSIPVEEFSKYKRHVSNCLIYYRTIFNILLQNIHIIHVWHNIPQIILCQKVIKQQWRC